MQHIMLDLETMSSQSNGVIVSIGAVRFDLNTGKHKETFYQNIDIQSCLDIGLDVTGSTIEWWLTQSEAARTHLLKNQINITDALNLFSEFVNKEDYIWGNSARFDCGLLQNAYNKNKQDIPWDFRKERCLRTLVSLKPSVKDTVVREGISHNALDDCYYQIKYLCAIWKLLNVNI